MRTEKRNCPVPPESRILITRRCELKSDIFTKTTFLKKYLKILLCCCTFQKYTASHVFATSVKSILLPYFRKPKASSFLARISPAMVLCACFFLVPYSGACSVNHLPTLRIFKFVILNRKNINKAMQVPLAPKRFRNSILFLDTSNSSVCTAIFSRTKIPPKYFFGRTQPFVSIHPSNRIELQRSFTFLARIKAPPKKRTPTPPKHEDKKEQNPPRNHIPARPTTPLTVKQNNPPTTISPGGKQSPRRRAPRTIEEPPRQRQEQQRQQRQRHIPRTPPVTLPLSLGNSEYILEYTERERERLYLSRAPQPREAGLRGPRR